MVKLELTEKEATLLHKVLDCYLTELAVEMAANGIEDFTEILHAEEMLVQKMIAHMKEQGIGILKPEMLGEYAD